MGIDNKKRGGVRPGAGRPKTGPKKKNVVICLPIELADQVAELPDKNEVAEKLFKRLLKRRITTT